MNWTFIKAALVQGAANAKLWLLARAKEKGTWTALASFAAAATGHALTPDMAPQIDAIAGTITGVVLIATKSQGSTNCHALLPVALLGLLLGACGTNSAGQPTIAGSLTVPGTSVPVADVAQQVSQQCAKKAPTDALLNGIALAAGASPGISLGLMTAEAIGGLACGYLAATVPAAAPAAPVPAATPVAATGG